MASEGGGKIRNKRGHSSSKPYERRKSLLSRITDSIKEVLRPSWLASGEDDDDDDDVPALEPVGTIAEDEGEEQFVSPAQSPSQLADQTGQSSQTTAALSPRPLHHPGSPGNATIMWQQGLQPASPRWEHHGQAMRSTWGGSAAPFDKAQYAKGFFAQRQSASTGPTESSLEISSRGLGGPAPSRPSTSSSQRRLPLSDSDVATSQQRGNNADSMLTGTSALSESSPDHPDDNPSKRQRLWSPEMSRKGRPLQPPVQNRPEFKISVFCSPSMNDSLHESPFYSGKTTYGGASAYRRRSGMGNTPYQNALPLRKSVTAKPLNNSGNAVLSSSATQILKTLERLSDAKRSRVNDIETESLLSFTPSSYRKPSRPLRTSLPSRSLELPVHGPPTRRLQSPAAASIAKNHQIVSFPAQRSQPPAATVTSSMLKERRDALEVTNVSDDDDDDDVQVVEIEKERPKQDRIPVSSGFSESSSSRSSGKMKHPKTYETRRGKPVREEDELVEVPNLRTDFTLPIQKIPGFNLGLSSSSAAPLSQLSSTSAHSKSSSVAPVRSSLSSSVSSSATPPQLQYTFSSPIQKSKPESSGSSPSAAADFQFSSPLKVTQSVPASNEQSTVTGIFASSFTSPSASFTPAAWGSTAPKPKATSTGNAQQSPVSAFSSSKTSPPVSFGGSGTGSGSMTSMSPSEGSFKPAAQLKSGSVMDILGGGTSNSPEVSSASPSPKPAAQLKQGSVMDILGGKSSAPATTSVSSGDSLFAKFAAPPGSWECGACMLQNKPEAAKCVACETRKPGSKQKASAPATSVSSGDSLFAKFAAPPGSWECGACMLQNKPEAAKCVACETPKPGSKPKAASIPSVSSGDSLFAKFAAPPGSWDCGACMLQNKPEAAKCVACETPKPGGSAPPATAPADSLMAKFRRPVGDWDCEVCLVQNTAAHSKCLACETPRPGTQATGSVPPSSKPAQATVGPRGGLVPSSTSSSSSKPSPFLAAATTATDSSGTGFKFGAPAASSTAPPAYPATGGFKFGAATTSSTSTASSTTSFAFPATGGFKFGTSSSGAKDSSGTGGFKFGNQDSSNSNSASSTSLPTTTGFQLGARDSTDSNTSAAAKAAGFKFGADSDSKTASSASTGLGFQFSAPDATSAPGGSGGLVFGETNKSSTTRTTSIPQTTTVAAAGFTFGSTATTGGMTFGSPTQSQSKDSDGKSVDKLTSVQSASKEGNGETTTRTFTPVFGTAKPSNSFSLGAAPSLTTGAASSLTTGGFQFGSPASSDSAVPSVFGSNLTSKVASSASDSSKQESASSGSKLPSLPGGFSFGATTKQNSEAAPKPGLFASALADSSSKNGPSGSAPSSSTSQGFVFNVPGATSSASSNPFNSVPQLSTGGFGGAKPAVNGEIGAPGLFAFGQQSAAGSSATGGFSFGASAANSKDKASAQNSLTEAKQSFVFGGDTGSTGKVTSEKRHLDNDLGPGEAKKRSFNVSGAPSTGEAEGFKFGSVNASGNSMFKFGQTEPGGKAPSITAFGGQASGFGAGTQGGFGFSSAQSNAASSTGVAATQAASVFGAGAGSTSTGQFSFSVGAGSQSNAAAASPFGSDAPAPSLPTQGFSFSGANQSNFNFGTNSSTNTSAPIFQFGATQTADTATAPGNIFMFGQEAPSADSTAPASTFTAPTGFGAAPAQSNFNIGTGEGPRKIKRAVRRTVRK